MNIFPNNFLALGVLLGVLGVGVVGCDRDDHNTTTTPGEKVQSAAEKTGEVLDAAAQKTGEVLGKAADATANAASKVATELQAATRPTTLPGGM